MPGQARSYDPLYMLLCNVQQARTYNSTDVLPTFAQQSNTAPVQRKSSNNNDDDNDSNNNDDDDDDDIDYDRIEKRNSTFLQTPQCPANCRQHVRSSGPGAIVWKSRATHRELITCNMPRATCTKVQLSSEFTRIYFSFIY